MGKLSFGVQKRLQSGDFGEDLGGGFHMADLGREDSTPGPPAIQAEATKKRRPLTRAARQKLAGQMTDRLMQQYMMPSAMNDANVLNPIRDGIPQCSAHPFAADDARKIGCIYGCGNKERQGSEGVLPVAREGTVSDVWAWVQALVFFAIETQDKRTGLVGPAQI